MTLPPIVLLGREGLSTRILHNALRQQFGPLPVIVESAPSKPSMLKRRAKRNGLSTVVGQVLFRVLKVPRLAAAARDRRGEIFADFALDPSPLPSDVAHVPSANSARCMDLLRAAQPRVVVVSGTRILSGEVLHCTPAVFVNVHAGITPLYRGVHGGYWALVQGDPDHCGVTVHCVDEGIDTGAILAQATIQPTASDNFTTYPVLQLGRGMPALLAAVQAAVDGCELAVTDAPTGFSRLWTHPTLRGYLAAGVP
jgi:methionyl-tRNA formyltransferase